MSVRRFAVHMTAFAAVTTAAVLLLAGTASAKENMTAVLTSPLPTKAAPGTHFPVTWEIGGPAADGRRVTFDSAEVFIRLLSAGGGKPTEAFARFDAHTDGRYAATATVPAGGIGGVEIGVAGTREYSSGKTERSDYLFPVADPAEARSPGAVSSWDAWIRWVVTGIGTAFAVAAAVMLARRARRWQRPAPPAPRQRVF